MSMSDITMQSDTAEQSVLGSILLDNDSMSKVRAVISAGDFANRDHAAIFTAMRSLIDDGHPADTTTVLDKLGAAGRLDYLEALAQSVPSASNVSRYSEIVREHAVARMVLDGISNPMGRSVAQVIDIASRRLARSTDSGHVRALSYVFADDLPDADEDFDDELVEGVLGKNTMSVLYGASNSGKTFAAIDLGAAVAHGSSWLGRRCTSGLVIYLATEAAASVEMRLKAYQRHHDLRVPGFVIVQSPVNLFDGQADVTAVLALINKIEIERCEKVALIVGDTLARIAAGANENAGEDMTMVLRNADAIRSATGATFLWIHHSGKDAARGMRGWSGVQAAVDTEIECTGDESKCLHTLEITKQRDLPGKGSRLTFRLQPITLGRNHWGTPRASCVIEAVAPESDHARAILRANDNTHAEQVVREGFALLVAQGITPSDKPNSSDYLPRQLLDKGIAKGHDRDALRGAMGRLMTAGIFARGVVGTYPNRHVREGLVLAEGCAK